MRVTAAVLLGLFVVTSASAQSAGEAAEESPAWSYYAAGYAYFTPDDDYLSPVFQADRDWLHLEARYNYEGQETVSLWAGYNFAPAEGENWSVTPMLGAVFGETDGIAPGVEISAAWKRLSFYTEGEHLFVSGGEEDDFTYFWSQLTWSPADWIAAGIVSQRTRAYQTDVDVMRGVIVECTFDRLTIMTSLFEPGSDDETLVVSLGAEF